MPWSFERAYPALSWFVALVALTPGAASAQQIPNAGTVLQGIERSIPATAPPSMAPPSPATSAPAVVEAGPKVLVTGFRIHATQFPQAALQALLASYIGRENSLGDLRAAASRIGAYYAAQGFLARAYLPPQQITDGVVTIDVLEGKLGQVVIDPSSHMRLDPERAKRAIHDRNPAGAPVRFIAIEGGVALLTEEPGMRVAGTLEPGATRGTSDLRLKVNEGPPVQGYGLVDNQAQRAIGTVRGIAMVQGVDVSGRGDLESLLVLKTAGAEYARAAASLPIGDHGLRLGVNASGLRYAVGSDFNAATPDGWAYGLGLEATMPLWYGPHGAIDGRASFTHRRLTTRLLKTDANVSDIDAGTLGIGGNLRDGGGITRPNVSVTLGNLDLGDDPANAAIVALTSRTAGVYAKFNAGVDRIQNLWPKTELVLRLRGQLASKNLDPSESISLGGSDGVAGYPDQEAQGAQGFTGRIEFGYRPLPRMRLSVFWDGGVIQQFVDTWPGWQGGGNQPNVYGLQSVGLGAFWSPIERLSLSASLSHVVGSDPSRFNNYDNDAERKRLRAWAQAMVTF